ncbi:MAG: Lrp/AsnC family transcriptional regulator [Myxococcales bacterium]|nr:Lrp/AsnC family transcriptional regulator [Myxococcales bacterium]
MDLDRIDYQVLDALQHDAKIPLKKIGEMVGLSAPSVLERIRKLELAGIIRGYRAEIDAHAVGLDVAAFIGVSVQTPATLAAVERWVAGEPQIQECHHVTGGFTLMLKVKTRNTRELQALISRIRSLDGVASTETMVVLSSTTERTQIAFDIPEEDDAHARVKRAKRRAP